MTKTEQLEFTIIMVPDKKTGQFTAFFAQFPQAIAVGETETEAQINLIEIVRLMLADKKNEIVNSLIENFEYTEKRLNAELSL